MSSNDGSKQGGRGRGRSKVGEQPSSEAPSKLSASSVSSAVTSTAPMASSSVEIGRRGTSGRRAEHPTTITKGSVSPSEKGLRGTPPDPDSPSAIAEKYANLELIALAPRPGYGSCGRKYRMYANHFDVSFSGKKLMVNHYHVGISHDNNKIKLDRDDNRPLFWKCIMEHLADLGLTNNDVPKLAFDGVSNLYTINSLKISGDSARFRVRTLLKRFDREMEINVEIKPIGPLVVDGREVYLPDKISMTPIQFLDILLRQYRSNPTLPLSNMYYSFRNSIFMIPGIHGTPWGADLGAGREIWKGLFTSVHVGPKFNFLVNMDVDHTVFYKHLIPIQNKTEKYSVLQYLCDVFNDSSGRQDYQPQQMGKSTSLNEHQIRLFNQEIKGLKIRLLYTRQNANEQREYRVISLDQPAHIKMFKNRDGNDQSVADYYSKTYGPLKFPHMPTLKAGRKQQPINLPMEHCYMAPNQRLTKKLTENQVAGMIRHTCMPPADRKQAIEHMARMARFDQDPFLKEFGVKINPNMVNINGRVLPAPGIEYSQGRTALVRDGVWRAGGMQFHIPASMEGVACIAFGPAPRGADQFIPSLLKMCGQCGMKVPAPDRVFYHLEGSNTPSRVAKAFDTVVNTFKKSAMKLSLVIVFLPVKGSPLYAEVKRIAEVQLAIMTQCIVSKTVAKSSPDTLLNIALKINMKLGGINCKINAREQGAQALFKVPTLVLGIDVTHPGPTDSRSPSIASVVGSMDLSHMRYAASIKVQKQRRESLVYLCDPVTDRLMQYYKAAQIKPQRLIVFRDGVSEGEFQTVLREELRGIREACTKVDASFRPKVTLIICQKRHHTRLFPADPQDGCGKHRNVHPGSVVDNDILFHEEFSFFLCSHAGIQGTSRPTRYCVLHDDNKFSADELQLLTYYLCHCYSRCTRAVSIPAPVYYAHLACTRARSHLDQLLSGDDSNDSVSIRSGGDVIGSGSIQEEQLVEATTVKDEIRRTMYFT